MTRTLGRRTLTWSHRARTWDSGTRGCRRFTWDRRTGWRCGVAGCGCRGFRDRRAAARGRRTTSRVRCACCRCASACGCRRDSTCRCRRSSTGRCRRSSTGRCRRHSAWRRRRSTTRRYRRASTRRRRRPSTRSCRRSSIRRCRRSSTRRWRASRGVVITSPAIARLLPLPQRLTALDPARGIETVKLPWDRHRTREEDRPAASLAGNPKQNWERRKEI